MSKRSRAAREQPTAASFTVAIVGRPNVGKSTLFNRLVGRRDALVHDRPGVTRDRKEGLGSIAGLAFRVFDTAGFEDVDTDTMEGRMRRQTEKAVKDADVALFLVDAAAGVTTLDESFAEILRRSRTPIVIVANKSDVKGSEAGVFDAYRLGLGEPVPISAEHGAGLDGLYHALAAFAPPDVIDDDAEAPPEPAALPAHPLQLAIIGRPNTGKSTLVNRLLNDDRMLTGPEPGVTRDSVSVDWIWQGRPVRLVDTAGIRKRAKITDAVEKLSVGESFNVIRMAEVVVLVVDAQEALDKQELTLARHVVEEGRALVIAINKWDAVKEKQKVLDEIKETLDDSLAQARGVPVVTISALTGQRVEGLMDAVFKINEVWNIRISTSRLNRWLSATMSHHPPPLSVHKTRIKLRYMTQAKARPPTFVIFSSRAGDLPEDYMRYLMNNIREAFDLDGVPIRLYLRKPANPYADGEGD